MDLQCHEQRRQVRKRGKRDRERRKETEREWKKRRPFFKADKDLVIADMEKVFWKLVNRWEMTESSLLHSQQASALPFPDSSALSVVYTMLSLP